MDNYNQDNNYYSPQDYQQPYGADNSQNNSYQQPYGADNSQNNSYQQPYGSGYNQTPSYQQPNYNNINNDDEHVSVLMWIGIFCINLIPCVGSLVYFIMMFVWAFGSTPKKSLKNFARAQLIVLAVVVVIFLILFITSMATGAAIFSSANRYSYY